tara:strand:- start:256 stop:723 length:468 start_codon:yes stop_codon:yes gene_type:complete
MPSLSEKRLLHYANRQNAHSNTELSDINLNTDELETKLDTIISNTNHNQYSGSSTTIIAGHSTETTIPSVDLGSSSAVHKLQIVGTTTHSNIISLLEVSNDNINWFINPQFSLAIIGTTLSGIGDICFRYFRMKTTDNTGSPITIVVEYSAKNLN